MKSTTILAKKYGVTSQTIREWIKSGRLKGKVTRTRGGHFRFIEEIEERKLIYARVSSAKQKKSIDKQ